MAFRSLFIPIDRKVYAVQYLKIMDSKIRAYNLWEDDKEFFVTVAGDEKNIRELVSMTATYYSPSNNLKKLIRNEKANKKAEQKTKKIR